MTQSSADAQRDAGGQRGAQPGQEQMLPREERPVPPASPAQAAQLSSAFLLGALKGTVTSTCGRRMLVLNC